MNNNEDENNNPNSNNFPVNVIEQKETKNIYLKKQNNIKPLSKANIKKNENENIEPKPKEETEIKKEKKNDEEINNNDIKNIESELKPDIDIKKENLDSNNKSTNNNTFNIPNDNKIVNELKLRFNDIIKNEIEFPDRLPIIKTGSYLTELPSEVYNNNINKKKATTFTKNKYKESSKVIKYLKEKENSLNKEITSIKVKKERLTNISFNNLGLSDIEKNRNNFEKKKLQNIENNLIEKLNEVKSQIKGIYQREKILKNSKSNLIQNFIKKYENEDLFNIKKLIKGENKNKKNKIQNKENNTEENKKNESISDINNNKEKTEEEKKEEKRREKIKEEVLKLEKNPIKQNYLFFKMANSFEEKEKLFYKNMKSIKKSELVGKLELKELYQKFKEKQKELKKKANIKTIEMRKEWRSNSLLLPRYKSPILKIVKNEEKEKIEKEEEKKELKKKYFDEKYNIEIPLPKISIKLRKENLKQNFSLNDLHGRDRVKYIKEELIKINNLIKRNNNIGSIKYKKSKILNKHKKNEKLIKNIQSKTLNNKEGKQNIEIKNYLEESKKNTNKKIPWNKYLIEDDDENKDGNEIKLRNIRNIKGQIEGLDNNVNMKKEMLKINGGFFNNQKLGNQLTNLLINSINGKISVIKAMNN